MFRLKKLVAVIAALTVMWMFGMGAFASSYGDPTQYGNNYGYESYGYNNYGCTGMRTSYSEREYNPSQWFEDSYTEEYGVKFHLYPTSNIIRSDVFASVGKAMDKAYREAGRNFSTSYGVNFVDFTWSTSLYNMAGGLYARNIMVGYEDNTVRFANNITRGELAKILVLVAKENGIGYYNQNYYQFPDMIGNWASQYATQCQSMGLMYGKAQNCFAGDDFVTYEEYVAIMIRLAEKSDSSRYSMDTDDVAYGISTSMDIDFEGYDYGNGDGIEDITIVGNKTVECEVGNYVQLKVKASPSDVDLDQSDIDWEISKTGYLKSTDTDVNGRYSTQRYKALKVGTVYVTAESSYDDDISVKYTIKITDDDDYDDDYDDDDVVEVNRISVTPSSVALNVGSARKIECTAYPTNATNREIDWSSDDASVATVNSSGVISAIAVGSCTITATANDGSGVTATIYVTVASNNIPDPTPDPTPAPDPTPDTELDKAVPIVTIEGASKTYVGQEITLKVKCLGNYTNFEVNASDIVYGSNALSMVSCEKTSNNVYTVKLLAVEPGVVGATVKAGVASNNGSISAEPEIGIDIIVFTNAQEMAEYNVG